MSPAPDFEELVGPDVKAEVIDGEAEGELDEAEDEDCGDDCGCDEEDPFVEPGSTAAVASEEAVEATTEDQAEEQQEESAAQDEDASATTKKKAAKKKSGTSRLLELAKARPKAADPAPSIPTPVVKEEKKPRVNRPSLLLRLRPTNLEECWEAFEASGFQEAPKFAYAYSDEVVAKYFQENSNVCFELLPEAKRILQKVQDDYGSSEAFMAHLYGERKIPAEEMRSIVADYLKDLGIEDKVEIRLVDNMLSAANVTSNGGAYVVNIANGPISWNMVQGICDHEVGTHLLRMMNDEHQAWHGIRDRYKLANPWTTEEGFATLNTYQSMPCRLMYPQALRYYAVCRGAQSGFVELFQELMSHTSEPKRCWQMCCRIKRGMIDTSLPGAFYLDQAYFKGAVEILRHLDEVDFGRLYGGQIALQDMDKVHFLLRKEVVRLPRFLNSAETLVKYKAHCRRLIKENLIETAMEKVCKPVFIRTAHEFFKPVKPKGMLSATIAIGDSVHGKDARSASVGVSKALDAERLADLARPRPKLANESELPSTPNSKLREFDPANLSLPRRRAESEAPSDRGAIIARSLDVARLEDLAKPRHFQMETESDGTEMKPLKDTERKALDPRRLLELALPRKTIEGSEFGTEFAPPTKAARSVKRRSRPRRKRAASLSAIDNQQPHSDDENAGVSNFDLVPPPPAPFTDTPRSVDETRLAELATPRKKCDDDKSVPCKCPPRAGSRRKRRSKHRIIAMVQDRQDGDDIAQPDDVADLVLDKASSEGDLEGAQPNFDSLDELVRASPPDEDAQTEIVSTSAGEQMRAGDNVSRSLEFSAAFEAKQRLAATDLRPASEEEPHAEQRAELRPEYKPRSRAVARARSLGAAGHTAGAQVSGHAAGLAALVGGLGARSPLPFDDIKFRPRLPIGLPRGVAAAVAAAAQSGAGMAKGGGVATLWKAVPIKVMQFDFCGL